LTPGRDQFAGIGDSRRTGWR